MRLKSTLIACAGLMFANSVALAQTAGNAGFEGTVLDSSGNPLANAVVELSVDNGGSGGRLNVRTDANGFYAFESQAISATNGISLSATCNTSKGTAEATQAMYWTLRDGAVYHRDFKLTLPKKAKGCL